MNSLAIGLTIIFGMLLYAIFEIAAALPAEVAGAFLVFQTIITAIALMAVGFYVDDLLRAAGKRPG